MVGLLLAGERGREVELRNGAFACKQSQVRALRELSVRALGKCGASARGERPTGYCKKSHETGLCACMGDGCAHLCPFVLVVEVAREVSRVSAPPLSGFVRTCLAAGLHPMNETRTSARTHEGCMRDDSGANYGRTFIAFRSQDQNTIPGRYMYGNYGTVTTRR